MFNPRSWHFYHCKPLCHRRIAIINHRDRPQNLCYGPLTRFPSVGRHNTTPFLFSHQVTILECSRRRSFSENRPQKRSLPTQYATIVEVFDYVRQALPIPAAGPSCRTVVPIVTSMSQANNPEEPSGTFPPPAATGKHSLPTASRHPHQSCVVQISTSTPTMRLGHLKKRPCPPMPLGPYFPSI